jgi:predicted metallo-beta-lactamase superfamily hydrolase
MGVRSMATIVESNNGLFFIDPGAALAPRRYGLPPHDIELKTLARFLDEIHKYVDQSDYLIITHYHRDHYLYRRGEEDYYRGKILLLKNPHRLINRSQAVRAYVLLKKMNVEAKAREVVFADGLKLELGGLTIEFSHPLPHGDCKTKLGYVLATTFREDGYVFTFASDTQGFMCDSSLEYILSINPDFLVVSGPPTYLGLDELPLNTIRAVERLKSRATIVIDHHLLRDKNYAKYIELLRSRRRDISVKTAAEYMGVEVNQLEAHRDLLWMHSKK